MLNFIVTLLLFQTAYNKPVDASFIINTTKFTVAIPAGFNLGSQAEFDKADKKGSDFIKRYTGLDIETGQDKSVLSFNDGHKNILDAMLSVYDSKTGTFNEQMFKANKVYVAAMELQSPGIKIDSVSANETISGHSFFKFTAKATTTSGKQILIIRYESLFNNIQFCVSITADEARGKQLDETFRKCKITEL